MTVTIWSRLVASRYGNWACPVASARRSSRPHEATGREQTGSRLHGRRTQSQVGDRHHLPADGRRLGLPRGGDDLFSRKVGGWSLNTELASQTLRCAVESRRLRDARSCTTRTRLFITLVRPSADAPTAGHRMLNKPHRLLLREYRYGAILVVTQAKLD